MTRAGASDIVIDVHGLTKSFDGRAVVRDLSMQVKRGTIYGFLGPNGSGKTTTIRMLCGLLTPDEGTGTCLGYDIRTETDKIKRQVGYMTQRFSLYQDLSVRENLEFVARIYGMPQPGAAPRATMIERLGLKGREEQLAGALSGGWKQRLALGACTLPNPQLLLLDEPTAGVDPKARREFWNEIHALAADGLTVLVSTHYMDEAERCHEIAYIAYGELLAHGTVERGDRRNRNLDDLHRRRGERPGRSSPPSLSDKPGVDMVAPFGTSLHVSGRDRAALEAAIAPYRDDPGAALEALEASLEDVFIDLMGRRPRTISNERARRDLRRAGGFWRRIGAMLLQGIPAAAARPRHVRHDHHDPADAAPAVRLRHQHHAARPADGGAAAGDRATSAARSSRRWRTPNISRSRARSRDEAEFDQRAGLGRGAVRDRNSARTSSARCGAATSRRCWSPPTPPIRWRPARRSARSAQLVQTALAQRPRPSPTAAPPPFEIRTHARYNPAAVDAAQHRARACSAPSSP